METSWIRQSLEAGMQSKHKADNDIESDKAIALINKAFKM